MRSDERRRLGVCGKAAADRLAELVGSATIACDAHGTDPYGRIIATCFVGGVDLGQRLVECAFRAHPIAHSDLTRSAIPI